MLIVGLPFTERALSTTTSGGTPYGASGSPDAAVPLTDGTALAWRSVGVADIALRLTSAR
jgi:NAD(P)H dehydrogenase (quinone)